MNFKNRINVNKILVEHNQLRQIKFDDKLQNINNQSRIKKSIIQSEI